MQLSIIIVSYNVRYFLEQCLLSVRKAVTGITAEILVIDNASTDGTQAFLETRFPEVNFSWNKNNIGFAGANNEALKSAKGEFILFLNPDTIVPEDCFRKCLHYLDQNAKAGALGIHMVDGTGRFLPESRRAFPSPLTSFFKLTGLATLFPRSPVFARYHMGHMDQHKTHETDVLSGAFMLIRKSVLDKTGGFDEAFFMYGEDIDLSYRIQQAGYKNIYFSESIIIHFKGESTKKGSLNYVKLFYTAMSIFVKKHFHGAKAGIVLFFIRLSIWLRAMLTAIATFIRNAGLPLIDAALILVSFWLAKMVWNSFVKPEISYSHQLLTIAFPIFTILFLVAAYYTGLYDKPQKRGQLIRSAGIAALIIVACYALWPESFRFSRGILLLGITISFLLLRIYRYLLIRWRIIDAPEKSEKMQTIVAGTEAEYSRIVAMLKTTNREERILGRVSVTEDGAHHLVSMEKLTSFLKDVPVREIIFCENGLDFKEIIGTIVKLKGDLRFRISASGSESIVGSDSKNEAGETFAEETNYALANPVNRRLKRLIDVLSAALIITSFPVGIFFLRKPFKTFGNALYVLAGSKTWIGYFTNTPGLPYLRKSIIGSNGTMIRQKQFSDVNFENLDRIYARDYSAYNDVALILKNYRQLCG